MGRRRQHPRALRRATSSPWISSPAPCPRTGRSSASICACGTTTGSARRLVVAGRFRTRPRGTWEVVPLPFIHIWSVADDEVKGVFDYLAGIEVQAQGRRAAAARVALLAPRRCAGLSRVTSRPRARRRSCLRHRPSAAPRRGRAARRGRRPSSSTTSRAPGRRPRRRRGGRRRGTRRARSGRRARRPAPRTARRAAAGRARPGRRCGGCRAAAGRAAMDGPTPGMLCSSSGCRARAMSRSVRRGRDGRRPPAVRRRPDRRRAGSVLRPSARTPAARRASPSPGRGRGCRSPPRGW